MTGDVVYFKSEYIAKYIDREHVFYTDVVYIINHISRISNDILSIIDLSDGSIHYVGHICGNLYNIDEYRDEKLKKLLNEKGL